MLCCKFCAVELAEDESHVKYCSEVWLLRLFKVFVKELVEFMILEDKSPSSDCDTPFQFWQVHAESLRGGLSEVVNEPSWLFCWRIADSKIVIFFKISDYREILCYV